MTITKTCLPALKVNTTRQRTIFLLSWDEQRNSFITLVPRMIVDNIHRDEKSKEKYMYFAVLNYKKKKKNVNHKWCTMMVTMFLSNKQVKITSKLKIYEHRKLSAEMHKHRTLINTRNATALSYNILASFIARVLNFHQQQKYPMAVFGS